MTMTIYIFKEANAKLSLMILTIMFCETISLKLKCFINLKKALLNINPKFIYFGCRQKL